MDPFNIDCETCAAKLKVKNPSAVGQRLACPKCGNMIFVAAPEDWVPPHSDPTASGKRPSDSSESEFEDVDQVLEQNGGQEPNSQSQNAGVHPVTVKAKVANKQTPGSLPRQSITASEGSPLLPDESWTNHATRKRRKQLLLGAAIFGLLLLTSVVVLAIASSRNKSNADVADTDTNLEKADPPTIADSASPRISEEEQKVAPEPTPETNEPEQPSIDGVDSDEPGNTDQSAPPEILNSSNETAVEDLGDLVDDNNQLIDNVQNPKTAPPANPSPFGSQFSDILNQQAGNIENVETNFGDLSDALESSGSSLYEINQLASLNVERRRIGLPKYFIKTPSVLDSRNLDNLNDPCAGVQYTDHSLLRILAEINLVTGVPVSFDAGALGAAEFNFGSRLTKFELTKTNFQNVISSALDILSIELPDIDLQLVYDGKSPATISIQDNQEIKNTSIPMPKNMAKTGEEFIFLIKQLIEPGSWAGNTQEYSIAIADNQINAGHRLQVTYRINKFAAKWEEALAIKQGLSPPDSLQSKWQRSAAARSTAINIEFDFDKPILEYLALVQEKANVNIIVDFNSIIDRGWNPSTRVPADVNESSVGDLLDELSHSMDVSFRAINPHTFELTTAEANSLQTDLEFYNCTKILAGTLDARQLVELVRQALQSAGQIKSNNNLRVYFEDEIDSFIVVAPQNIQRLIETVLNRLADL